MNKIALLRSPFLWKATFFILVLLTTTTFTNAQGTTFAQFSQKNGTNDFIFNNNFCVSGTLTTIDGGVPVNFFYLNVSGLPFELQGQQDAHVFISDGTNQQASVNGDRLVQPISQTVTIQILRDTPASVGSGTRTNLLTAVITTNITPPDIAGEVGANSNAFTASTPNQTIVYTSDFISFNAAEISRNLALGFSSVTPVYSMGCGGFISSFTAAGTGTFAANPGPVFVPITAASVTVSGRVLGPKGTMLAGAAVSLINSEGETFTTRTNSFGYYRFDGVEIGQSVIISVSAKRYTFAPKAVDVGDHLDGVDFYPQ